LAEPIEKRDAVPESVDAIKSPAPTIVLLSGVPPVKTIRVFAVDPVVSTTFRNAVGADETVPGQDFAVTATVTESAVN